MGPGDVFEVRVFGEADLSGIYRIGPYGGIDFPFCGRVAVASLSSGEIADRLHDCLANGYIKDAQVTVFPREYNSKKIFIFGHVAKPGTYVFEEGMTIIQAITIAGGFAQFAAQNKTSVTRTTEEGEQRFKVPVADIGVGQASNFFLQPGDIIFVPEGIY
jgi:polysaccharide export outer membrane protein